MPVPSTMADLSPVAASNSPAGSSPVGPDLDNHLRAHAAIIRQFYDDLASSDPDKGAALVGFKQNGTGSVGGNVYAKLQEIPSLLDFIPVTERPAILAGTSTYDCTAAVTAALADHNTVRAVGGLYNVSTFSLASGKRLLTDGFLTTFQQIAGQPIGTRMIVIAGSNVEIGSMTVRGNIATDTDEQQHAIFVQANATTGNISNITVGNVNAHDVRGDVIYIGQSSGLYKVKTVRVGDVYVDNVYRNGVSVVSGDDIEIKSVTGDKIGFCHLDVEPNVGSGTSTNIRVGYIKGRTLGLNSPTAADYVDAVTLGQVDLSPSNAAQSVPSYTIGASIADAVLLRNVKRAKIDHLRVDGYNRCAIFTTYNSGELGAECVEIGTLSMRNCSLTDTTYNSYVQATQTRYVIDYLDVAITQTSKRAFDGLNNSKIGGVKADIQTSSVLLRNSNDCELGNIVQTGANGFMLQSSNRIKVKGGSFTGDRLATSCDKCAFENFTATAAVFLFSSGQEDHTIINSTLNGDYYSFGTGIRDYLNTMRFGPYRLWVSSDGKLRIKSSAPANDTDGTIVGTQT